MELDLLARKTNPVIKRIGKIRFPTKPSAGGVVLDG
tara:strand:+ start:391 stop:498 length:108 start_codon:yes stop_codon:yes gene_type:complete